MKKIVVGIIFTAVAFVFGSCNEKKVETVKVGIIHSLSGTMSISESPVMDSELLAINEINSRGGVLGRQIEVIIEDGKSEPKVFAEKTEKLLTEDKVATIFGCWTSASRKAVKPILEEFYGLLWYPVQYEGMEASPNIMYMGAIPNQQIIPAVDYCLKNIGQTIFLIGSDYVFPRTSNKIIKAFLYSEKATCVGEEYVSLGSTDFSAIIEKIKETKPSVIINTLNGDSNIAFFNSLLKNGITSAEIPVMSFSISEEEIAKMDSKRLAGNLLAWNYFETTDTPENAEFIKKYKGAYGEYRMTGDPIEAGYIAVNLWAKACEKAGSFDVEKVRIATKGISFDAPEGNVTVDGGNQHLCKTVRIGRIKQDGLVEEIWTSSSQIRPDPYLSTYSWAHGL